jgi:hypothetical protein
VRFLCPKISAPEFIKRQRDNPERESRGLSDLRSISFSLFRDIAKEL